MRAPIATALSAIVPALLVLGLLATCTQPTAIVLEPLRIINWSPAGGAFCVETSVTIHTTFSHDLDPASVTSDSFYLLDASGRVPASLSYDAPTFTVRLVPEAALGFERLYTVVATSAIAALEAGHLAVDLEASFRTVPRYGCTPGVECSLPSDCETDEICANIGICMPECVTDRDCYQGSCDDGECVPVFDDGGPLDDGGPGGDSHGGDPGPGDDLAGDPAPGDDFGDIPDGDRDGAQAGDQDQGDGATG